MRYSYEYKRKCVKLYREGKWPETPDGIKDPENFRHMVRRWVRMEEAFATWFDDGSAWKKQMVQMF